VAEPPAATPNPDRLGESRICIRIALANMTNKAYNEYTPRR